MEKSLAFWLDTTGHQHVPLAHFFQLQLRSAEEVALTAWVRCARFPVRPGPQPRILGCFLNYFIIIFHILYSFTNCCMKLFWCVSADLADTLHPSNVGASIIQMMRSRVRTLFSSRGSLDQYDFSTSRRS